MQFLIAIAVMVLYGSHPAVEDIREGSYVVRTLNGRSLPADLRVPALGGDFRLFRLEQGVLRLARGGRFTLHFRYYHQLVRRGGRPGASPVMSASETGTYTIRGDTIRLIPRKKSGTQSHAPISATIGGETIRAAYLFQDAGSSQRVTLVLRRDASFW